MTYALRDVIAERERQKTVEHWTPRHDDRHHDEGELAKAAACYAIVGLTDASPTEAPTFWPWDIEWWKPTNHRRNLVKAGALILAEIERLDRAALASRAADVPEPAVSIKVSLPDGTEIASWQRDASGKLIAAVLNPLPPTVKVVIRGTKASRADSEPLTALLNSEEFHVACRDYRAAQPAHAPARFEELRSLIRNRITVAES